MKCIVITFITPASENIRGTSALPYHLMKGINENVNMNGSYIMNDIVIYSFNTNKLSDRKIVEVEKELGATIKLISLPKWYIAMFKLHLLFLRVFLKLPFSSYVKLPHKYVHEINKEKPDLIWVMGEELFRVVKQFPNLSRIHIGPDTESLYYYRMMAQRFVIESPFKYWKCALMYKKYTRIERDFCTDENFTYYVVGNEDLRHLQQLNPEVKAKFLRHPHYEVREMRGEKSFHQPKIKVLIAGRYDLYMKQKADELNSQFIIHNSQLKEHYVFTFLGKGWERNVELLKQVGYKVEHIKFAPDYIEEICKHDIQITPITIGTGTKGKVLDALANGLLVIGTPYAMENIEVRSGESCIEYTRPEVVIEVLVDILNNRKMYEQMATLGRQQVLEYHNRAKVSRELFGLN